MPEPIEAFLRTVALFAELEDDLLEELAAATNTVHVPAGAWLFREGDVTESMYVVRCGRVQVVHETSGDVIRMFAPGDVCGELAFLTGSPRAASARAMRDSELVELKREQLAALLRQEERFATALLQLLGRRLQDSGGPLPSPPKPPSVVTVLAAGEVSIEQAVAAVVAELGSPLVLDWAALHPSEVTAVLDDADRTGRSVILRSADSDAVEWRSFCVRQADRVLVVADVVRDLPPADGLLGCDLAVVGGGDPEQLAGVLQPRCVSRTEGGWGIAARRLLDSATALVLSGGGARGLAHVGAFSELVEAGFAPDIVGGCSIGAFVGAMVAMGWDPSRIERACRAELAEGKPFRDYTMPRVSLIKARRAEAMLARIFGDHRVEDLPIPFFTVAADLVSGELVVERAGLVREAVAASMSLPGLAPPVQRRGQLLVDGGVVDNLPIDVVLQRERAFVVAVDVMRRHSTRISEAPRLLDTIARASTLGSWPRTEQNRSRADVLIVPDVADIGLLEFDAIDRAIVAGRAAARTAVPLLDAKR